jgi:hypothetical protein
MVEKIDGDPLDPFDGVVFDPTPPPPTVTV